MYNYFILLSIYLTMLKTLLEYIPVLPVLELHYNTINL